MRIIVADDDPKVRSALRLLLEQEAEVQVVAEAQDTRELFAALREVRADLLILDWELHGCFHRATLISLLRTAAPPLKVIALSGHLEARRHALRAGADAFVSKSDPPEQLLALLRRFGAAQNSIETAASSVAQRQSSGGVFL